MDELRMARERFLATGASSAALPAGIVETRGHAAPGRHRGALPRAEIATSWRRSQLVGVAPDSDELPFVPNAPIPRRLVAAAAVVIDAVATELADTTGTVLLADPDVRILDRRVGTRSWLNNLDRHNVAPGFVFAEEFAGTNGLGCAIEEARLFEVSGAEHFRESLQSFVCIAAPIRHPVRRTLEGVLNLTCSLDEYSPFARTVLRRAVADIEQRLLDSASRTERLLLENFVCRSKRSTRPLAAVGADVFICNPAASSLLERADRDLLWYWAAPALSSRSTAIETIDLTGGRTVRARATRVGESGRTYGALIEIDQLTIRPRNEPDPPPAGSPRSGFGPAEAAARSGRRRGLEHVEQPVTGRSAIASSVRAATVRAIAGRRPVLVTGEPGSGRRRIARTILTALGPDAILTCLDAGQDGWYATARSTVQDGRPLLLRDAHLLGTADAPALRRVLEDAEQTAAPVAATSDGPATHLVGVFSVAIAVPPLRDRRQDVRDLAQELLGKVAPDRTLELHPGAVRALEHHGWPGNVRELQLTLSLAAQACVGSPILERHLPEFVLPANGTLSPIERAERDTILAVLNEAGGNKLAAAAVLGVARSTLYRKMRALKIDDTAGF